MKKIKKILIESFPCNEKYIYDLEEFQNGIEHGIVIKYSDLDPNWSRSNPECIKYIDTGNGVELTIDGKTISIPYSHVYLAGFVIKYKKSQEKIKSIIKVLSLLEEEENEF